MSDVYDRAKASAGRMLGLRASGGKGAAFTLKKTVAGAYDPDAGTSTTTSTDYAGSAFRDTFRQSEIDGARIKQGDVKFLVSPLLVNGSDMPEPKPQDLCVFDGSTYTVQFVLPMNYAGLAVGFEVQARK